MQNLDIYILTSVVATLFIVFIFSIWNVLKNVDETSHIHEKEGGPRVALFNLMAKLFEDKPFPELKKEKNLKRRKKMIYQEIIQTMSDMESDGVRFPEDIKEELRKNIEELHCEYSGLPSPKAYEKK